MCRHPHRARHTKNEAFQKRGIISPWVSALLLTCLVGSGWFQVCFRVSGPDANASPGTRTQFLCGRSRGAVRDPPLRCTPSRPPPRHAAQTRQHPTGHHSAAHRHAHRHVMQPKRDNIPPATTPLHTVTPTATPCSPDERRGRSWVISPPWWLLPPRRPLRTLPPRIPRRRH